jgi:hypothetical protein
MEQFGRTVLPAFIEKNNTMSKVTAIGGVRTPNTDEVV